MFGSYRAIIQPEITLAELSRRSDGRKIIWALDDLSGDVAKAINDAYPAGSVLASSMYPGPELLVDGDMEAPDTSAWTPVNNPTLSKITSSPYEGTRALRIARDATNNPSVSQANLPILDKRVKIEFAARSDGNALPRLRYNLSQILTFPAIQDWVLYSVEYTANAGNAIRLDAVTSTGNEYCDFDAASVREANPLNGDISGATIGQPTGLRAAPYAVKFDGINDYIGIGSDALNAFFNRSAGTMSVLVKVTDAGVWTDGTFRTIAAIGVNTSTDLIYIRKQDTDNSIIFRYIGGGVTKSIALTINDTGWVLLTMTWDVSGAGLRAYANGIEVGTPQTISSVMTGDLDPAACVIGAINTSAVQPWSGWIAPVSVWREPLPEDEIKRQAQLLGVAP